MITLKEAFLKKYPKRQKVLEYFYLANNAPATWENLSKLRLSTFAGFCQEAMAQSSARQYCAQLRSVLSEYSEEVQLPKDWGKTLTLKNEKIATTWLNEDDLSKLVSYVPKNKVERAVWARFLIGCYTGARHSDFTFFDSTNIVNGMLCYVSQKTKVFATVPLKPMIADLLMKEDIVTEYSDTTFNDNIRNMCRDCGITSKVKVFRAGKYQVGEKWQFVTSHTARRSFATNLYLRGADLYSISKMLGHTSVDMTAKNYICCGLRDQSEQVLAYFN